MHENTLSLRKARTALFAAAMCSLLPAMGRCNPPTSPTSEFRGVWVATVANIDWPSKPGLSSVEMIQELENIVRTCERVGLNAIVFQVRPACDAMYASAVEPWSEFLSGEMGTPPPEAFDPLRTLIRLAHAEGIEVHAWFNPYRALHPSGASNPSPDHVSRTHPDIVRKYGDYLWLDPGEPLSAEYSRSVIMDVVKRYDIDGVHFDDYFYPYPVQDDEGNDIPFPDEPSWEKYLADHSKSSHLSRDDWRRENVNRFVRSVAKQIKTEKPHLWFGISPFGIYRPGQPETIKGFDAYAKLYADSRLWLEEGVVDYLAPQLYWPIEQKAQSFPVLLDWWRAQNPHDRPIWPGLYTSKIQSDGKGWPSDEIARQIELTRESSDVPGHIHFSYKAIAENRDGVADKLQEQLYARPANLPKLNHSLPGTHPALGKGSHSLE